MSKNFVRQGHKVNIVLTAAVAPGAGVKVGSIFGVATQGGAIGATVTLDVEGVYTLPKLSSDVVAQGAPLYWDDTANKRLTTTAGSNKFVGWADQAQIAGDPTANVRLVPGI